MLLCGTAVTNSDQAGMCILYTLLLVAPQVPSEALKAISVQDSSSTPQERQ